MYIYTWTCHVPSRFINTLMFITYLYSLFDALSRVVRLCPNVLNFGLTHPKRGSLPTAQRRDGVRWHIGHDGRRSHQRIRSYTQYVWLLNNAVAYSEGGIGVRTPQKCIFLNELQYPDITLSTMSLINLNKVYYSDSKILPEIELYKRHRNNVFVSPPIS